MTKRQQAQLVLDAAKNLRHAAHVYHSSSAAFRVDAEGRLYLAAVAYAHAVYRPKEAERPIRKQQRVKHSGCVADYFRGAESCECGKFRPPVNR